MSIWMCALSFINFNPICTVYCTALHCTVLCCRYTTTAVGSAEGFAQGELQGAVSNLGTVVRVFTPLLWGRIYAYGSAIGRPSLIYYCSAASGLIQIALVRKNASFALPCSATTDDFTKTGSGQTLGKQHSKGDAVFAGQHGAQSPRPNTCHGHRHCCYK